MKVGYKECNTGHMAINSRPRDDRALAASRRASASRAARAAPSGRRSTPRFPQAEKTGKLDLRPNATSLRIEHNDAGKVTGVVYFDKDGKEQRQKARVVCVAGNSIETPRLLLHVRIGQVPRRPGQLLGAGRAQLHASHHWLGVRVVQRAGEHVPRHDHGGHHPRRGGQQPQARLRRRLRAWRRCRSACLSWPRSSIRARGDRGFTEAMDNYANMAGMWIVGEDMPQETNRVTLHASQKDQWGMPTPNVHFDDHPNDVAMREHAYKQGQRDLRGGRREEDLRSAAVPVDA